MDFAVYHFRSKSIHNPNRQPTKGTSNLTLPRLSPPPHESLSSSVPAECQLSGAAGSWAVRTARIRGGLRVMSRSGQDLLEIILEGSLRGALAPVQLPGRSCSAAVTAGLHLFATQQSPPETAGKHADALRILMGLQEPVETNKTSNELLVNIPRSPIIWPSVSASLEETTGAVSAYAGVCSHAVHHVPQRPVMATGRVDDGEPAARLHVKHIYRLIVLSVFY
ncbi:uncharacterized protein LOC129604550 isoform X1 [Betta splendens]|uniref:Uncharacterized protein LOC129604550 isoform X1 n=1 Tax=Betta splendens TaxID=158456 RepID=A0A9W2XZV4_BETSP|nr:uncharacterized protein LOC129604550 isoform X1 [Betta splendens]